VLHVLLGLLFAAGVFISDATSPQVIPALFPGRILVEADINGHSLWFHLDTGTSVLAVDRATASAAGMAIGEDGDAVADVAIGALHAHDAHFSLMDHYGYDDGGVHVSGLIGTPFFTSNVVTIDYARRELIAYPNGSFRADSPGVAATPMYFNGDLVFVHAWFGSKRATLLLDTGDQRTVLFSAFAKTVIRGAPISGPTTTTLGIGGATTTWRQYVTEPLVFGGDKFDAPDIYVADDAPAWMRADMLDGILGRDVLQAFRITLDYARNMLYIEHP
jgi:hypothetical protein